MRPTVEKKGKKNAVLKPSFFELELEKRVERVERILAKIIQDLRKLKGEN